MVYDTYKIKDTTYEELKDNIFDKLPEPQINFLKMMRYWYKHPKKKGLYVTFGNYYDYKDRSGNSKKLDEIYDIYYSLYESSIQIEGKKGLEKMIRTSWVIENYFFLDYLSDDIGESLIRYLEEEHGRKLKHINYPFKGNFWNRKLKRPFEIIKE